MTRYNPQNTGRLRSWDGLASGRGPCETYSGSGGAPLAPLPPRYRVYRDDLPLHDCPHAFDIDRPRSKAPVTLAKVRFLEGGE